MPEPPNDRQIIPEAVPQVDEIANAEANAIAQQRLTNKFKRSERVQKHLHWGALIVFWGVLASLIAIALVLFWHMVTPATQHFLSEAQRSELKTILLAVIGSSAVSETIKKVLSSE
ncbi:MAG: hypothetical protein U0Q16_28775 [Bryobacteraceae bacterium]